MKRNTCWCLFVNDKLVFASLYKAAVKNQELYAFAWCCFRKEGQKIEIKKANLVFDKKGD